MISQLFCDANGPRRMESLWLMGLVPPKQIVVVLSENAGSFEELEPWVLAVDPLDVEQTAAQLERALELPQPERGERAAAIRAFVEAHDVARWIDLQLLDLEFLAEPRA
jgi:trehalose 6-phosphate synthase